MRFSNSSPRGAKPSPRGGLLVACALPGLLLGACPDRAKVQPTSALEPKQHKDARPVPDPCAQLHQATAEIALDESAPAFGLPGWNKSPEYCTEMLAVYVSLLRDAGHPWRPGEPLTADQRLSIRRDIAETMVKLGHGPEDDIGAEDRDLPRSNGTMFYAVDSAILRITPEQLTFDSGRALLPRGSARPRETRSWPLGANRISERFFELYMVMLADAQASQDWDAEAGDGKDTESVLIHADGSVPMATLLAVMRAVTDAGVENLRFAVRGDEKLRRHFLVPAWLRRRAALPKDKQGKLKVAMLVRVDGSRIEIGGARVADVTALAARTKRVKAADPDETYAAVHASASTSWGQLVPVLDALAGPQCDLDNAVAGDGDVPDDCYFSQLWIALDPGWIEVAP